MNRRWMIGLGASGLAGAGAAVLHTDRSESVTEEVDLPVGPELPEGTRMRMDLGHQVGTIPDLELLTQEGKTVRFVEDCLRGKLVLINFMYTVCNGKCPLITENLVQVQEVLGPRLGTEVFLYSITLDPDSDTPEVLRDYAEVLGAREGWTFLTGTYEQTELLRRALGFVDPDPEEDLDRSNHAGVVLYGNHDYKRWGACPGLTKPKQLVSYMDWLVAGEEKYRSATWGTAKKSPVTRFRVST